MTITSIALRSFRAGQNLTFDTAARRILIAGPNGAGKSSVRDALAWALRGVCSGTDGKGLGWEALIPAGTTRLAVGLQIDGLGAVERAKQGASHAFTVEGCTGESSTQQQALFMRLNTTPAFLDAVLDTGAFLRLHHAEAKAFVLGLLDVRVPVGEESLTLDQLDARHKLAFAERTAAKARAKSLILPTKPAGEFPPVADIEARLSGIRQELQTALRGAGATAGKREAVQAQLRKAEQIEPWFEAIPDPAYLADLERQIAVLDAAPPTEIVPVAQSVPAVHFALSPDRDGMARRILTLKAHKPKDGCVLDPEVECSVAKIKFTNRAKELEGALGQMAAEPVPAPPPPPRPATESPLPALRRQLAEAQRLHVEFVAVEARNAARGVEAEALRAELASLKEDATASAEVETLSARIAKGEIVLRSAREFWQAASAYEKALTAKTAADGEVARLEALVDLLGPNGARVAALQAAVGPFEAKVNAVTRAFGWTVAFVFDPWGCLVNGRPVETYSESEQFRIGIALQLAIAELSGLSFAVVDRLDMLDVPNRAAVTRMLMDSPVGQILILATREPEQPLPTLPGVIAYRLGKSDVGQTLITEQTHG